MMWKCPECAAQNDTPDAKTIKCQSCGHEIKPQRTVLEFEGERIELRTIN